MPNRGSRKRKAEGNSTIAEDCDVQLTKKTKAACLFCLSSDQDDFQLGEILTKEDLTCHYFCLLLASGLFQNGRQNDKSSIRGFLLGDIRNELRRGLRLKCYYCHEKGATLGCCQKKCKKGFHLPCARSRGSLHQFFGGFGSFCDEHCPKQSLTTNVRCRSNRKVSCNICLCPLDTRLSAAHVLHSPCCNNSWFHRLCIQQYASSAGKHHFRCPICNCRKKFYEEMETFGIYVPDQCDREDSKSNILWDASWERQNGAFDELLQRHGTCDAEICNCPLGRNHDAQSGKYDLLLCSNCGSYGSHRTCRGLLWHDSSLLCPSCVTIAKECQEIKAKAQLENPRPKTSDSGSSSYRTSNSQLEARSPGISSAQTEEKVIHLEMVDTGDDVDVENDDDILVSDIHIPPFCSSHCSSKIIQQVKSLPSCSVLLQRVDTIIPLSKGFVNLKGMRGFSFNPETGRFAKKNAGTGQTKRVTKGLKDDSEKRKETGERSAISLPSKQTEKKEKMHEIIVTPKSHIKKCDDIREKNDQRLTEPKKKRDAKPKYKRQEENVLANSKRKVGRPKKRQEDNVLANSKRKAGRPKKIHTSLSTLKKQFLMKFKPTAQIKRRYIKRKTSPVISSIPTIASCSNSEKKKLVQSTLNFSKVSPPSAQDVSHVIDCVEANLPDCPATPLAEDVNTILPVDQNKETVEKTKPSTHNTHIVVDNGDINCEVILELRNPCCQVTDPISEPKILTNCEVDGDQCLVPPPTTTNESENITANILMDTTNKTRKTSPLFTQLKSMRFICREFLD